MARGRRRFTVEAEITAKDRASKEVKKASTSFQGFRKTLASIPVVGTALVASVVAVGAALVKGVKDAVEYSRALLKIDAAMRSIPGASRELRSELIQQAGALGAVTGESDTTILSIQSLLLNFGVAGDQIQNATQASVDLSAALGIDLNSAARNIGKTIGGFAGELGELIPELKELSVEALKAGEGIKLLEEKFRGTAVETRGVGEAFGEFGNALADFVRNASSGAVTSQALVDGIDDTSKAVRAVTPEFTEMSARQSEWLAIVKGGNLTIDQAVTALALQNIEQKLSVQSSADMIVNFRTLFQLTGSLSSAWAILNNNQERSNRLLVDQRTATEDLRGVFKSLGLVLEVDLVAQLEASEAAERRLEIAWSDGNAQALDYRRGIIALDAQQAELRLQIDGVVVTVDEETEALQEATIELERNERALRSNTAATEANAKATDNQTRSLRGASSARSSFGTPSGGTFTSVSSIIRIPTVLPSGELVFLLPGQNVRFVEAP